MISVRVFKWMLAAPMALVQGTGIELYIVHKNNDDQQNAFKLSNPRQEYSVFQQVLNNFNYELI